MTLFHPETPKKCPPKDAISPNGMYYRFVLNDPPIAEDFKIWILEPENSHKLPQASKNGNCGEFAISFLTSEGVARTSELFQRGMKAKAKARGAIFSGWAQLKLDRKSGLLKQTGKNPHHYDLWPYVGQQFECKVVSVKGI